MHHLIQWLYTTQSAKLFTVAVRGVHDNSGDIAGEHVDRHDGEHVPEDCGDQERVAAPVGENCIGGGARGAAGAAA